MTGDDLIEPALSVNDKGIKWNEIFFSVSLFLIFLLYFIYLPVTYNFDGTVFSFKLRYALMNGNVTDIIKSYSPLYFPASYGLYKLLNWMTGYSPLEYFHLQIFSLLFGMGSLIVLSKMVKKRFSNYVIRILIIFLIAFSYKFWHYSVDTELYVPGLFFIILGMYILFFWNQKEPALLQLGAAAFSFFLAVGFHLTNTLIVFTVFVFFLIYKKSLKIFLKFISFYALFFISGFLLLSIIQKTNLFEKFYKQLFGLNQFTGYRISYWASFSLKTFVNSLISVKACIFPQNISVTRLFSTVVFILMILVIAYGFLKAKNKRILILFGLWIVPYFIFFSFWDHTNTEFKLTVIVPFILLFAYALQQIAGEKKALFVLIPITLYLISITFFGAMVPYSKIENNHRYLTAKSIERVTPKGSTIVIMGCGKGISTFNKIYIPYFALRKNYIFDWAVGNGKDFSDILRELDEQKKNGFQVFFFSDMMPGTKAVQLFLKNHQIKAADYIEFIKNCHLKERISVQKGSFLYRY